MIYPSQFAEKDSSIPILSDASLTEWELKIIAERRTSFIFAPRQFETICTLRSAPLWLKNGRDENLDKILEALFVMCGAVATGLLVSPEMFRQLETGQRNIIEEGQR